MKYGLENATTIDASRVFLDQKNPRHEPFEDQQDCIDYLCEQENVLALAKDIAKIGLNPLELFAVIPESEDSYFAAEGNRRLCAIMLLNDPELAPANSRNEFIRAAENWNPVTSLSAVVFENREEVRIWLDRIHAGADEGRGRRQWKADQKARNSLYSKNDLALAILDAAQEMGFISPDERQGRLSTVQRYLGNPLMRDALGLDPKGGPTLTTDLPEREFDILFRKFMRDIATKEITTRDNAAKIGGYSHTLRSLEGVTGAREEERREIIPPKEDDTPPTKNSKPKKPVKVTKIAPSEELQAALKNIPSYKLEQIYYSLCSLNLNYHTPLLFVGAWSFIETLTALCGRTVNADFYSFLNGQFLEKLGVGTKNDTKAARDAIKRISDYGNSTKHNRTAAGFNGEQLANDFETIETILIALAKNAQGVSDS